MSFIDDQMVMDMLRCRVLPVLSYGNKRMPFPMRPSKIIRKYLEYDLLAIIMYLEYKYLKSSSVSFVFNSLPENYCKHVFFLEHVATTMSQFGYRADVEEENQRQTSEVLEPHFDTFEHEEVKTTIQLRVSEKYPSQWLYAGYYILDIMQLKC